MAIELKKRYFPDSFEIALGPEGCFESKLISLCVSRMIKLRFQISFFFFLPSDDADETAMCDFL
jgi:hypothetical protein